MSKIEIVGYPQGNILKITKKQFDLLNEEDLVMFDDEWTEEKPNGQWGFNNSDEDKIIELIKEVKMNKETLEEVADNSLYSTEYLNESERIIFKKGCVYGAKSDAAKDYWFEKFKQQEDLYSKEDMMQFGLYLGDNLKKLKGKTIDEIFEQFKKK